MKRMLSEQDIVHNDIFLQQRQTRFESIRALKKNRRIALGDYIMFYFENHETLCWQIQEMLRVEKGGAEQLKDELTAYIPLLPRMFGDGTKELVATMMIEVDNLEYRQKLLNSLGGIENHISLFIHNQKIQATSVEDVERTTEAGKTSSVHFLRFKLTCFDINAFQRQDTIIKIKCDHPKYIHEITLTNEQKTALSHDFK